MGRQRNQRGKDPRDTVNVSGREWIPYAGILDIAHGKGLKGIDTELIQIPDESNGNVAIVKAIASFPSVGPMEDDREFSGIGDASPENVSKNIVPHIIRQAETRAKARALGDAVNRANVDEASGGDEGQGGSISHLRGAAKSASHGGNVTQIRSAKEAREFVEKNKPENPGESGGGATVQERSRLIDKVHIYQDLVGQERSIAAWEERNLEGKKLEALSSEEVAQYKFILENLISYKEGSGEGHE